MESHKPYFGLYSIKLGCLLFWAFWFSLAFLSNLFDFVNALYGLSPNWHFRSDNYEAVAKAFQIYNTPSFILNVLFILNLLAQSLSAILFFSAFFYFMHTKQINYLINIAFGVSIALWAIFIILEEVFIDYTYEAVHMRLLILEIIMLLFIHLIPMSASER